MAQPNTMQVKVRDTQQTVFDGPAERITSYNEMGRFDVYPAHANFISILSQQIDIYNNHQNLFASINDVYNVKRNVLGRLSRNAELRGMLAF